MPNQTMFDPYSLAHAGAGVAARSQVILVTNDNCTYCVRDWPKPISKVSPDDKENTSSFQRHATQHDRRHNFYSNWVVFDSQIRRFKLIKTISLQLHRIVMADTETKIITVSLPKALLLEIDSARGLEGRSSFIRRSVNKPLASMEVRAFQ